MCSVQDVVLSAEITELGTSELRKCMKCGETAVTIARTKDPFCCGCFCAYFKQRFRSTLGKSRLIKPGEKVLISFSGGPSSRVLLELIEQGVSVHSNKRIPIIPSILYIDEGAVYNQTKLERYRVVTEVLSITKKSGFPTFIVTLEQQFGVHIQTVSMDNIQSSCEDLGSDDKLLSILTQNEETLQKQLLRSLDNFKSSTAKENFLLTLRQNLLIKVAKIHNCTKVFVGDNANKVSSRLLGNIAQGKGSSLPLDTGLFDDRSKDIVLLRPLREFPCKEIKEFLSMCELPTVQVPTLLNEFQKGISIEGMAETFINGLQDNFPSTVNTIFRTGEKLYTNTDEVDNCVLCKVPLLHIPDKYVFNHLSPENIGNSFCLDNFCYGCRLTVKDMKVCDIQYLPLKEGEI